MKKMKSLKERMNKIDKICQNITSTYNKLDVQQNIILQQRDLNRKEQDINQCNIIRSNNIGCIISKDQVKKEKQTKIEQQLKLEQQLELKSIRSQTATMNEIKQYQEQSIEELNNKQQQKVDLQKQIDDLVQQKRNKQIIQRQESKTEQIETKQIQQQQDTITPIILKLQQEKLSLENEINQIGIKINEIRFNPKQQEKQETINKRNWREEKKYFEQQWLNLESQESKYYFLSFEERLQTYLSEEFAEDLQKDNEKDIIDKLSKEVEELMLLDSENQTQNQCQIPEEMLQSQLSQKRIQQIYTSPLQVIEEEPSIDQSFQL